VSRQQGCQRSDTVAASPARGADQTAPVLSARFETIVARGWDLLGCLAQRPIHFVAAHPLPCCRDRGFPPTVGLERLIRCSHTVRLERLTRLHLTRLESSGPSAAAKRFDSSGSSAAPKRFDASGSPAAVVVLLCISAPSKLDARCKRCGSSTLVSCGRVARAKVAAARSTQSLRHVCDAQRNQVGRPQTSGGEPAVPQKPLPKMRRRHSRPAAARCVATRRLRSRPYG
jgi:hypothetical protein